MLSGGVRSGGVGDGEVEQSSDTACTLQRAGEVFAPEVADCRCRAIGVGNAFLNEIPIIVEESRCRILRYLLHAAGFRIVEIGDKQYAIRRYRLEPIGGVVCVCPISALRHVPVCVMREFRVLVDAVRRPVKRVPKRRLARETKDRINYGSVSSHPTNHLHQLQRLASLLRVV